MHRAALWILGEYSTEVEDMESAMRVIKTALGELPLVEDELKRAAGEQSGEESAQPVSQPAQKLTSDGTYVTQSAFTTTV